MLLSRLSRLPVCLLAACLAGQATAKVIITEFDATNRNILDDADGSTNDWIELRNTGASSVNLAGWAISDKADNPGKWVFPSVSIPAGGYLIVFASSKDWSIAGVQLHTNFSLSDGGEDLVLSRPDGSGGWITEHAFVDFPEQFNGFTYGLAGSVESGEAGYLVTPTPGFVNVSAVVHEFVEDTAFSHHRGFYDAAFTLTVTSPTPGASIVYTLDGSEPGNGNGYLVNPANAEATPVATLEVSTTTIVRARAVKDGMAPTNIDTQTFLFPAHVLQQSNASVKQAYANWGHSGPDWAMDPRVTGHPNPEDRAVASDLEKIPTVSVAMSWTDLFGSAGRGIYILGEGVDKPASFELLNPDGNDFDPNALAGQLGRGMIRVFGGSSTTRWKTDKLSFRFNFWDNFESDVLGEGAIGEYDRLVLDARLNNVWNQSQNLEQRQFSDFARDAVLTDLENEIGVAPAVHSQHVHLYLNGLYWGIYTLHERPDNHFAEAYFGGDSDDYDIVKHGPSNEGFLVDGVRLDPTRSISNSNYSAGVNYLAMVALSQQDLSVPANYDALAEVLDIPAFIVHILGNFAGGNYDWPQHNWYASYNRESGEGKWRFHSWDAEHVFKYEDYPRFDDVTNKFEGWDRPDGINLQLLENAEYRFLFADTAHCLLFNGGPLSAERVWAAFERRFNDIDEAVRAESARWGDNPPIPGELHLRYTNVPSSGVNPSSFGQSDTTDFASWWHERERIRTKVLGAEPNRITRFVAQMRNATYHEDHPKSLQANPLYPQTDAPAFSQHGGQVAEGFALSILNPNASGAGEVYYTLDGSDPRKPGSGTGAYFSGTVNDTAQLYGVPVTLDATTTVKSRVLLNGEWSALNEATFQVGDVVEPAAAGNLVISEVHYHPANPSQAEVDAGFDDDGFFEYFEVRNIGSVVISLEGITMPRGADIEAIDGGVTVLAPGATALYVSNPEAFALRYGPGFPIAGRFINDTALSNGGEQLQLNAADGSTIVDFEYDDGAPWPTSPDGDGPSLVLIQPGLRDYTQGWNWRASISDSGSPAADDYLTYAAWAAAWFSAADPGYPQVAAPDADADGDGLTNLEEHFLATDPKEATAYEARPLITLEALDAGAGLATYAVFTFRYDPLAEGVAFSVQGSNDLRSWTPGHAVLVEPPTLHDDGTETRRYRSAQPVDATTALFYYLRLESR
ncbi:MAG: lamin tail domain-containing protein [Verrucomicrobiota bacterium JB022]|nr:lamin tail domain-containing protein [Verrucomicrobiota bacterium JB022]